MKVVFRQRYLSIEAFQPVDLPHFAVITGLNGSGKTHFLKAMRDGSVAVDIAPSPQTEIRFFDWSTMVPQDVGTFDGQVLLQERTQLWQRLEAVNGALDPTLGFVDSRPDGIVREAARRAGLSDAQLTNPKSIAKLTAEDLVPMLNNPEKAETAATEIEKAVVVASEMIKKDLGDQQFDIADIALLLGKPIYLLERDDLFTGTLPSWGRADLFQQSFGRLFVAYRDLALDNKLRQLEVHKGRSDILALSDAEFVAKFGGPPWEFVNQAISAAGLGFSIDQPNEFSKFPYSPTLKKNVGGAIVRFNDLSSGEKILMSLAFCLHYAQDRRQISRYPKVLLLDEIDAPLHPSMCRSLIRIVEDVLVRKEGIAVVLTTHSASTVALAPEKALFAMTANNPGLNKIRKSDALNILTVGVPTLALSYDGRRQVFVESPADAQLYEKIYALLRRRLASERSLEFIATGTKGTIGGSDVNTGCDVVVRIVNSLVASGNLSVFGLIDWDQKHNPSGRIAVLAAGLRDGIENVVLDPLLLAGLIVRDARRHLSDIGVDEGVSYPEFLGWSPDKLQVVVAAVQDRVLGLGEATTPSGSTRCEYEGGFSLLVRSDYLKIDDHALEERVLNAFPRLNAFAKGQASALMRHMVDTVMQDRLDFMPAELSGVFRWVLEAESHSAV